MELSANQRLCWQARARLVREWRERVRLTWLAHNAVQFERAKVAITIRHARTADHDGCVSACKALLDGLTPLHKGGWACLPDDSPDHVTLTVQQEVAECYRLFPEVRIQIAEAV